MTSKDPKIIQRRYPFKFLDAYTREDSAFFFGRTEEVNALYEMSFQSDLLLVFGASGTGKTSMIQCGLASKFESHDWLALNIRRGNDLNASVEKALVEAGGKIEENEAELDWLEEEWLTKVGISTSTKTRTETTLSKRFQTIYRKHFKPIYLIFDQFEELYILGSKAEQSKFIATVQEILTIEQPVKIIISIREEYLGYLYEFERAVPSLLRKKLRVEPMNLDKVRTVIKSVGSLAESNVRLKKGEEDAIAEALFDKIRDKENSLSIQLPYLQVVLDKLYLQISGDESRQAEAEFSLKAMEGMSDIGDVLRNFLDEQVMKTASQIGQTPEEIWAILSPFVTLDGTKEPVSEEMLQKRLPELAPAKLKNCLQIFINARLVRYFKDDELYEIAHDSLAKKIAEKRSDEEVALLRVQQIIKGQIAFTAEARVFSETQLNFIKPFLAKLKLRKEEEALIAESEVVIAAQKKALLAEQAAEMEKMRAQAAKEKKLRRRAMYVAALALVISIVALCFYFWALSAEKNAKSQEALARDAMRQAISAKQLAEEKTTIAEEQRNKAEQLLEDLKTQKGITAKVTDEKASAIEEKDKKAEEARLAQEAADKERRAKELEVQKNINAKIEEIKILLSVGDKIEARKLFDEAIKVAPQNPDLLKLKEKFK